MSEKQSKFKENDTVYFIDGKYPKQTINCGVIEFFFECNVSNDNVTTKEKFACIRTDNDRTKGGMQVSLLFKTPDAARAKINAELADRKRNYNQLIHRFANPLENAMRFAMKYPVCKNDEDPVARQVFIEYAKEHGLPTEP